MNRITNYEFLGFGALESRMVAWASICTAYCFEASDGDRVAQGYPFSLSFLTRATPLLFITLCRLAVISEIGVGNWVEHLSSRHSRCSIQCLYMLV